MPEQQKILALPTEMGEGQTLVLLAQDGPVPADDPAKELTEITEFEDDQDILDDLGEIEFLLDEIEDQIAPLAL